MQFYPILPHMCYNICPCQAIPRERLRRSPYALWAVGKCAKRIFPQPIMHSLRGCAARQPGQGGPGRSGNGLPERAGKQQYNEGANQNHGCPGNDIEENAVDAPPHQAAIVDEQDNKDQQDRNHCCIQIL